MANSLTVPNLGPTAAAAPSLELPARIANIATTVLNDILILAAVIAVFFIIYGGYNYISSGGDATKAKTAQATILNSVIGIIVIASAFGLVNLATRVGLSLKAGNDSHLAIDSSLNTDKINVHSTQVGPKVADVLPGTVQNHQANNPYAPHTSQTNYPNQLLIKCTDTKDALTVDYCQQDIFENHTQFCASVFDANSSGQSMGSRYCTGYANSLKDVRLYCNDLIFLANKNGSSVAYLPCNSLITTIDSNGNPIP